MTADAGPAPTTDRDEPPTLERVPERARPDRPGDFVLPFDFHQRVLIVGTTRSGKSVLAEMLVESLRPRVLVIDPKGQAVNYGPRRTLSELRAWLETTPTREQLADGARIARWVPERGEPDEYEPVYDLAHRYRGPIVVVTDELYGPGNAQTAPRALRLYLTQGGGLRHGHIGLSQRPANVCMEARTEWDHLVVYRPAPDPADLRKIALSTGVNTDELLEDLRELPKHGFVWIDRADPSSPILSDPVPLAKGRIV